MPNNHFYGSISVGNGNGPVDPERAIGAGSGVDDRVVNDRMNDSESCRLLSSPRSTLQQCLVQASRSGNITPTKPSQVSGADDEGNASIMIEIISMSKNVIGSAVLSMSGGLALFADTPHRGASITAILWIVFEASIFAYFCVLIAKICDSTRSYTFRGCWERTVGRQWAWMVVFVIIFNVRVPQAGALYMPQYLFFVINSQRQCNISREYSLSLS